MLAEDPRRRAASAIPPTIQRAARGADRPARPPTSARCSASVGGGAAVPPRRGRRAARRTRAPPVVGAHLLALVRKEFVRPDRSAFAGDDGFRFRHVLIRDVAYASIPKELRAELHERFADWLEQAAASA